MNAGLTQVLGDGTNTYLYGAGRISQTNTDTEYFLGDALGSVRQLTEANGEITLAKTYDPYGTAMNAVGSGSSSYGFASEQADASGLVYLRARFYSPSDGRFLTKDPSRAENNLYLYARANPINYVDPSGYITENEAADANDIVNELETNYGVKIVKDWGYQLIPVESSLPLGIMTGLFYVCGGEWQMGNWRNIQELDYTLDGVKKMADKLGGADKFRSALAEIPITFRRMSSDYYSDGESVAWTVLDVKFYNKTFDYREVFASGTVVHELAHVWDTRQTPTFSLSSEMSKQTKSYRFICPSVWSIICPYQYDPNGLETPPTEYGTHGEREDFADSFAICVYPSYKNSLGLGPIRKNYIEGLINGNECS
jgi:RHS repeat-associated protein